MNYSIDDILNQFKNRILLSDFLSRYLDVQKKGNTYVCRCPFHHEKTPSFTINNQKGLFYCFGCGTGGNVITFLTKYNNISFPEALKVITDLLGLKFTNQLKIAEHRENEKFYKFTNLINNYFKKNLIAQKKVINYLVKRGVDKLSISRFELGFCGEENIELERYLFNEGFKGLDFINYGITINTKYNKTFHRFQNRITFPIFDYNNNIVGFGGRTVTQSKIKYINSPESNFFKKSNNLFGFRQNIDSIKKSNQIIIVEGYMDVISLYTKKISNAVASLGTALSENQIKKIWQFVDNPIVCFDGDLPGKNAMDKVAIKVLKYLQPGKSLRFFKLPLNEDPDNYIQNNNVTKFKQELESSKDLCEQIWENLIDKTDDYTPEYSVLIDKKINDLTKSITNPGLQREYSKFLRERKNNYFWEKRKSRLYRSKKDKKFFEDNSFVKNLNELIITSYLIFEYEISRNYFEKVNMINFQNKFYENLKKEITLIYLESNANMETIQKKIHSSMKLQDIEFLAKIRDTHYIHLEKKKKLKFFESTLNASRLPILIKERDLLKNKLIEKKDSEISKEYLGKYEKLNQEINSILGKEIE